MRISLLCLTLFFSSTILSQTRTLGLVTYTSEQAGGYVLFSPMASKKTFLIDKCGKKINEWTSDFMPGVAAVLGADGNLYRTGHQLNFHFGAGHGGYIERFDWNGNLTWRYKLSDSNYCLHHDIKVLPNGHILAIAWEKKTIQEAVDAGKDPNNTHKPVWSEIILELSPKGFSDADIVWQWKSWDHIIQNYDAFKSNFGVVEDHPEKLDINFQMAAFEEQDWLHINSVDYNADLDQIIVSAHSTNEIYIIDHSTTTLEAAGSTGGKSGKGGDILYRWGNPQAYGRGGAIDMKLFRQHHATWIPKGYPNAGKIMLFNNGMDRPDGAYSTIEIITPPIDGSGNYTIVGNNPYGPVNPTIFYKAPKPTDFYSNIVSGVYPLKSGGVMATTGTTGAFWEINSSKTVTWKYINPVTSTGIASQGSKPGPNTVFRAEYYPTNFAGFSGKTLTPQGEIEMNAYPKSLCDPATASTSNISNLREMGAYPNPTNGMLHISGLKGTVTLSDINGKILGTISAEGDIDISHLAAGAYLINGTHLGASFRQLIQKI